jgi:starch-binding outer membrane protein, SusD/RagB family
MRHFHKSRRAAVAAVAVACVLTIAACSSLKNDLLEAPDPDIIDPSSVQSAPGATAVRIGALSNLRAATVTAGNNGTDGTWLLGGLLADEWSTSSTFVQNDQVDERQTPPSNSSVDNSLRLWYRVITAANQAIGLLNKYKPAPASDIAEMYFVRGFTQMQLANDFCNGIPLTDAASLPVVLGIPLTNAQVFTVAVSSFDSAMAFSSATDAASVAINRAAAIGKARALLGLNQPAAAATAVTGIPTTYTYDVSSSLLSGSNNGIWSEAASQRRYTIGDSLEGNDHKTLVKNAIPFFSAKDPRLPASYSVSSKGDTTKSQDGLTFSRTTTLYAQTTSIAVVNGIDARLIEAEAALRANQPAQMIQILNALRATPVTIGTLTTTPSKLPPLVDPGTADARINLLFREKAFWTFSRGERLGDLRRLIRQYGRTATQVFPEGDHYRGTTYGTDVNLPITQNEANGNPNFTSCIDRNA